MKFENVTCSHSSRGLTDVLFSTGCFFKLYATHCTHLQFWNQLTWIQWTLKITAGECSAGTWPTPKPTGSRRVPTTLAWSPAWRESYAHAESCTWYLYWCTISPEKSIPETEGKVSVDVLHWSVHHSQNRSFGSVKDFDSKEHWI